MFNLSDISVSLILYVILAQLYFIFPENDSMYSICRLSDHRNKNYLSKKICKNLYMYILYAQKITQCKKVLFINKQEFYLNLSHLLAYKCTK